MSFVDVMNLMALSGLSAYAGAVLAAGALGIIVMFAAHGARKHRV